MKNSDLVNSATSCIQCFIPLEYLVKGEGGGGPKLIYLSGLVTYGYLLFFISVCPKSKRSVTCSAVPQDHQILDS